MVSWVLNCLSVLTPIIYYGSEVLGPLAMSMFKIKLTSSTEDKYDTLKFDKFQSCFLNNYLDIINIPLILLLGGSWVPSLSLLIS